MSFLSFLEKVEHVVTAFEAGYHVGHEINEHVAQHYFDEYHAGSGDLGDAYIHAVDKYGDPAPAIEHVQHFLDTHILHEDQGQSHHDHGYTPDHSGDHSGW